MARLGVSTPWRWARGGKVLGLLVPSLLLGALTASACADGKDRRHLTRGAAPDPTGGEGGLCDSAAGQAGDGTCPCSEEVLDAQRGLVELHLRHGLCAAASECIIVADPVPCGNPCGVAIREDREPEYLEEITNAGRECSIVASCAMEPWKAPEDCPRLAPDCVAGVCRSTCAGLMAFEERLASTGRCGSCELDGGAPDLAEPCCTDDGSCGSGIGEIFGGACFEVGDPGRQTGDCPEEAVSVRGRTFILPACCLASGACGLDSSSLLGAGCIERALLGAALQDGCWFEPAPPAFESLACSP